MNKVWIVFKHEYTRHVLRKRFIFAILSIPLAILIMVAVALLSVLLQINTAPVGYIDRSGLLTGINPPPDAELPVGTVDLVPYTDEVEARAALEGKKIQAYFVVPEGYPKQPQVRLVYYEQPSDAVTGQFSSFLKAGLLRRMDPRTARRLQEGPQLSIEDIQEDSPGDAERIDWFKIAAPFAASFFLIMSVFTSGGYLMQAVVEEKENRTMEILATSLSPGQIMSGKILALMSAGLTQVAVWSAFPLLALALAGPVLPSLAGVSVDWKLIGLIALTTLPTFVLISALMAAIGASVANVREGQSFASLFSLVVVIPYMLLSVIMVNPGGAVSVALSLFPLTAALTLLLRMAFASVPGWQIALSTGLLVLSSAGSLWLAGRVFRLGLLRYGKRLGWRDLLAAVSFWRAEKPQEARP